MIVGLAIVVIAVLAIAFASYRIGGSGCDPDVQNRDSTRNTSLVVLALGVMCVMFGVLTSISGSLNPMNALTGGGGAGTTITL
jgi:cell division protein FtsX